MAPTDTPTTADQADAYERWLAEADRLAAMDEAAYQAHMQQLFDREDAALAALEAAGDDWRDAEIDMRDRYRED